MPTTIDIIAAHFTGPMVVHQSVCLQLGGPHATMARRFFDTRDALGITGYASFEEGRRILTERLERDGALVS